MSRRSFCYFSANTAGIATATVTAFILAVVALTLPVHRAHAAETVVSLDYRGDRLERLTDAPTLSILSDGQVVMPQIYSHTVSYAGQIAPAELAELLTLMRSEGFFDDGAMAPAPTGIRRESHHSKTVVYADDGADSRTVIAVDLRNQPRDTGLRTIVQHLERIMSIVKLGGEATAREWLDRANAEFRLRHPSLSPLQLDNLESGVRRSDGSINVVFSRASDGVRVALSVDASGQYGSAVYPKD